MSKTIRVKNTCTNRVGVVSFGDFKPNEIRDMELKVWKRLHKPWPESRPYRCERLRECLIVVDKDGNPVKHTKKKKAKSVPAIIPPSIPTEEETKPRGEVMSTNMFARNRKKE